MSTFVLALALMASAPAEARTGSRLDPNSRRIANPDLSDADASMYRFVECTVNLNEGRMRKFLDSRDSNEVAEAALAFDAHDRRTRCNVNAYVPEGVNQVNFATDRPSMRGMVAEAFVRKNPAAVAGLAPLAPQTSYGREWQPMTGRPAFIDEMATCAADINPAGVVAVTKTEYGSKKQKKALAALGPTLGICLQAGVKLNTNPLGLRTALAEALYHRVYDAPVSSGQGGGL